MSMFLLPHININSLYRQGKLVYPSCVGGDRKATWGETRRQISQISQIKLLANISQNLMSTATCISRKQILSIISIQFTRNMISLSEIVKKYYCVLLTSNMYLARIGSPSSRIWNTWAVYNSSVTHTSPTYCVCHHSSKHIVWQHRDINSAKYEK